MCLIHFITLEKVVTLLLVHDVDSCLTQCECGMSEVDLEGRDPQSWQ